MEGEGEGCGWILKTGCETYIRFVVSASDQSCQVGNWIFRTETHGGGSDNETG